MTTEHATSSTSRQCPHSGWPIDKCDCARPSESCNKPDLAALADEVREACDMTMECYMHIRSVLSSGHLRGGDLVMLKHPFKDYFITIHDNLGLIAKEIEAGEWHD